MLACLVSVLTRIVLVRHTRVDWAGRAHSVTPYRLTPFPSYNSRFVKGKGRTLVCKGYLQRSPQHSQQPRELSSDSVSLTQSVICLLILLYFTKFFLELFIRPTTSLIPMFTQVFDFPAAYLTDDSKALCLQQESRAYLQTEKLSLAVEAPPLLG